LLNQTGEKTPENLIDPELPATGKRGLRFSGKTASWGPVIGRRPGEGGNRDEKKRRPVIRTPLSGRKLCRL